MIPAFILFIGLLFLPESPRWLVSKGRYEEAHEILALVHGKGDKNHPWVLKEIGEIKQQAELERGQSAGTYWELLKPKYLNQTHIAVFTQIWSQLTGMNVMMYYITYVFQMAGLKGNNLLVSSSIQYVINVVMTVPGLLFVDRWGRRPTMMIGALLMATWMFANAGILATHGTLVPDGVDGVREVTISVTGAASKAVIACSYLFVASYAPTWGPVSWIYPNELFSNRLRGKAVSLATSANWAFNTALGEFVPVAFQNINWKTYIIFGVFNIAMCLHVFLAFPETAGRPLEEVTELFERKVPAWKTGNFFHSTARAERGDLEHANRVNSGSSGAREDSFAEKQEVERKSLVSNESPRQKL